MAEHVSWDLHQRQYPKIYQYSYFSLKTIKNFVVEFWKKYIKGWERILDVWCGNKPYEMFLSWYSEYVGTDVVPWVKVDVVCDNDNLPFKDGSFDVVLCNQTLEHTRNVHGAVEQLKRVTKPGWYVLVTAPFLYPEHACPHDYYRFTRFWFRELLQWLEIIEIIPDTWYFKTMALFTNILFTSWALTRKIFSPFFLIINCLFWSVEWFVLFLYEKIGLKKIAFVKNAIENHYKQFTLDYMIIARKPE